MNFLTLRVAPVRDARGVVIAAVSVSGPIDRIGRRPGARWAADLVAAAEALLEHGAHVDHMQREDGHTHHFWVDKL